MEACLSEIRSAPACRSRPAIKTGQQGIPAVTRGQYGIPNAAGQGHLQQGVQIWPGPKEIQATYARVQEAVCVVSFEGRTAKNKRAPDCGDRLCHLCLDRYGLA